MVVIRRQNAAENYEDIKQPTTQNPNGLISKVLPESQEFSGARKWTFRQISNAAKHAVRSSFFAFQCLVTAIALLCIFAFLSPLLVLHNALRFVEKKLVYLRTGANAMTGQDALWLQDSEENRMIVNSVMVLEGANDGTVDKIRAVLNRCVAMKNEAGELTYPRLTKHIRRGNFQYFLEETENFDIAQQVFEYDGERPKSREELEEVMSRFASEGLRLDIPPWVFIVIRKGYADGEAVVLFRMHHSLADGISLSYFLAHVLPDHEVPYRPLAKFSNANLMVMKIWSLLVGPKIILQKLFSPADCSILHGPQITGVKRLTWSEPIDLQVIKRIKNQTGTTVNDVIMACLSMSLHDYFKSQGITDPPDVLASVPVDVRFQEAAEMKFENNFAIVSLKLPVSEKDIMQQLYSTKANMDEVKHSGEAFAMATAANYTVEFVPAFITNIWNKRVANLHSMVLSNVPGPTTPLTIGGLKTKELFFWPPQRDLVGIGIGVYSYAGKVIIGVQGDVNCLCKPQLIVKGFEAKIAEMERRIFNSTSQTEVDSGVETVSH